MRIRSPFIRAVKPYAEELLKQYPKKYPNGVTVDDLHTLCLSNGVIDPAASHKTLSGLGHAFRAAGGINSGETVASKDDTKKGARQVLWIRSSYSD